MTISHNDMLRALRGEPKAEAAIFWFCYGWQRGKGSDLYRILCESPYTPDDKYQFDKDPDMVRLFSILEQNFQTGIEVAYQAVQLDDVEDGDILIAGSHFLCIPNRWPCRVFKSEGQLVVTCKGNHKDEKWSGIHTLRANGSGNVIGFRR